MMPVILPLLAPHSVTAPGFFMLSIFHPLKNIHNVVNTVLLIFSILSKYQISYVFVFFIK